MKLIWKFNLVLLGIFVLGFLIAGYTSYRALQANAREEILQNARLMMESALSMRNYTTTQVKPLLDNQMKYVFLPQSVPAYAATKQFNALHKKHPDYFYNDATLNPSNGATARPTGRPTSSTCSARRPAAVIGERDTSAGRSLYLARPIQIKNKACLDCHSTVEAAPRRCLTSTAMPTASAEDGGSHRRAGVSVPMAVPIERARRRSRRSWLARRRVRRDLRAAQRDAVHDGDPPRDVSPYRRPGKHGHRKPAIRDEEP